MASNGGFSIFKIINAIFAPRLRRQVAAVNMDPEKKQGFKKFAIIGAILGAAAVGLVYPCIKGGKYLIIVGVSTNLAIIGNIMAICFGAALFLLPAYLALNALIYPINQLTVNRRWWSWASLIFGIICLGASIFLVVFVLSETFAN